MGRCQTLSANVLQECVTALLRNVLGSFRETHLTALVQTNADLELARMRAHHSHLIADVHLEHAHLKVAGMDRRQDFKIADVKPVQVHHVGMVLLAMQIAVVHYVLKKFVGMALRETRVTVAANHVQVII